MSYTKIIISIKSSDALDNNIIIAFKFSDLNYRVKCYIFFVTQNFLCCTFVRRKKQMPMWRSLKFIGFNLNLLAYY